jgi:hypothetical protein
MEEEENVGGDTCIVQTSNKEESETEINEKTVNERKKNINTDTN